MEMRVLFFQAVLIVATFVVAARLLVGSGQRNQAVRRLGILALAAFAIVSILAPELWTKVASVVGIGRGTDLLLYMLVVAFFSFTVTSYKRWREMELRITRLARLVAISSATRPADSTSHAELGSFGAEKPEPDDCPPEAAGQ